MKYSKLPKERVMSISLNEFEDILRNLITKDVDSSAMDGLDRTPIITVYNNAEIIDESLPKGVAALSVYPSRTGLFADYLNSHKASRIAVVGNRAAILSLNLVLSVLGTAHIPFTDDISIPIV